jgi:putative ABC transport system ATP-binding protein
MNAVELRAVKKTYMLGETEVIALRGVDLTVSAGEFITIAGPSGAGKSTILNIIGLIDNQTSGQVFIDGNEIRDLDDRELTRYRRQKIGFIFQSFNLIPVLNVYENIEFPLLLRKNLTKEQRRERVMRFIREIGLEDRIRNKSSELSGGQRQRVAIARALVADPIIVLADEPTANLDSETGERIISLMKDINKENKTTFIFSTHDDLIMKYARRTVHIRDGKITGDDTK